MGVRISLEDNEANGMGDEEEEDDEDEDLDEETDDE